MGIPVFKPPPRRESESWEDYRVRCGPWRELTERAASQSRAAFGSGIGCVSGVLSLLRHRAGRKRVRAVSTTRRDTDELYEVALEVLCAIIESGTGGDKIEKVRAAWDYAELFFDELEVRRDGIV